jgi:hypothetical protein
MTLLNDFLLSSEFIHSFRLLWRTFNSSLSELNYFLMIGGWRSKSWMTFCFLLNSFILLSLKNFHFFLELLISWCWGRSLEWIIIQWRRKLEHWLYLWEATRSSSLHQIKSVIKTIIHKIQQSESLQNVMICSDSRYPELFGFETANLWMLERRDSISMVGNWERVRKEEDQQIPLCPPLKLCRQNRVCGKEAVFDLAIRMGLVFRRNTRGRREHGAWHFTHLSGKYFYSLLIQSVPHSPTDAIINLIEPTKPSEDNQFYIFMSLHGFELFELDLLLIYANDCAAAKTTCNCFTLLLLLNIITSNESRTVEIAELRIEITEKDS